MSRSLVALVALVVAVGLAASQEKKAPTIGDKVLEYAKKQKGKQVGDGECGTLATEALKEAGAKGRQKDSPNEGDYVWGDLILTVEFKKDKGRVEPTGKLSDVKPGDVVQFRDAQWVTRSGNVISTTSALHHTAVVLAVDKNRSTIRTLHQNHNGKKVVQEGAIPLNDLKAGWVRVYRPVSKDE
jgi:hypothetical protein